MSDSDLHLLDQMAEEYIERLRRGERPTIEEYAARLPEHGAEIHELFPCLGFVDQMGSTEEQPVRTIGDPLSGLPSPQRLGEYRIIREVGRGGMGVVYEAEHQTLLRRVALKVLPSSLARKPQDLLRFRREARSAGRLHHSNIVPLFDIGHEKGIHFYTMQFIQGRSLDHVIGEILRLRKRSDSDARVPPERRHGPSLADTRRIAAQLLSGSLGHRSATDEIGTPRLATPTGQRPVESDNPRHKRNSSRSAGFHANTARIGSMIADALAYAHSQGVLHRDVKPANVLIDTQGNAWVTDFGLAKDDDSQLTTTGNVMGTMRYLAPEQMRGTVDVRGDIYSLGVTLYELVTAPAAISGSGPLKSYRPDSTTPLPRPRDTDPSIPKDLETIIWKAMAHEPPRRYQTASELAEDLRRYLTDRPIRARPFTVLERTWMWARRRPFAAAGITLLSCLLTVIVIGGWVLSARALRAERVAREQLMDSKIQSARALTLSRRSGQRFESLALIDEARAIAESLKLPPARYRDLREVATTALSLPDVYPSRTLGRFPDGSGYVSFDDSFKTYALKSADGSFSIRSVDGDKELAQLEPAAERPQYGYPHLSPNGLHLVVEDYVADTTRIWRKNGSRMMPVFSVKDVDIIAFDASGDQLACGHTDGSISRYELATGQLLGRLAPLAITREITIALHPREPLIALSSYFGRVVVVRDLRNGAAVKLITLPGRGGQIAWDPSGQWLAAVDESLREILVFDRDEFKQRFTLGPVSAGARINFSHAGDLLATRGWGLTLQLFDFRTGKLLFEDTDRSLVTTTPQFSVNDTELAAFADHGALGLWRIADGRECRKLERHVATENAFDGRYYVIACDDRLLAVGMSDGVGFWDLGTGAEIGFLEMEYPEALGFEHGTLSQGTERTGAILIGETSGLYRWPLHYSPDVPGHVRLGPAESLDMPQGKLCQSADGQLRVTCCRAAGFSEAWAGAWIQERDNPSRIRHLEKGMDLISCGLSPKDETLATTRHLAGSTQLWNPRTDELLREVPRGWQVEFSPDGRWFTTGGYMFDTNSWRKIRPLRGFHRFALPSDHYVTSAKTGTLALTDVATGREITRFTAAEVTSITEFATTPSGRMNLTVDQERGIRVWDLPLIQRGLAERNLAWSENLEGSSSGASAARSTPGTHLLGVERDAKASSPLTLQIDLEGFAEMRSREHEENLDRAVAFAPEIPIRRFIRAEFHRDQGNYASAAEDYRQAIRCVEKVGSSRLHSRFVDGLARLLATVPELNATSSEMVSLAELAIRLRPGEAEYETTLGMAYFRAGRWTDAVAALERGMALGSSDTESLKLYYLAMCHHRLDQPDEANACLARAEASRVDHRLDSQSDDLQRQVVQAQTEATALLRSQSDPAVPQP